MHDCKKEILEALNKLRNKSSDRMAEEFVKCGQSQAFWQEVSYKDAIDMAIEVVKEHTDCTIQHP